jgi:hypothetical protein
MLRRASSLIKFFSRELPAVALSPVNNPTNPVCIGLGVDENNVVRLLIGQLEQLIINCTHLIIRYFSFSVIFQSDILVRNTFKL